MSSELVKLSHYQEMPFCFLELLVGLQIGDRQCRTRTDEAREP